MLQMIANIGNWIFAMIAVSWMLAIVCNIVEWCLIQLAKSYH